MPLVKLPGFDEAVRRHTWQGERLPVPYTGARSCDRCSTGHLVETAPIAQPALFYHGGYGATERRTVVVCLACGHTHTTRLETLNPRHP